MHQGREALRGSEVSPRPGLTSLRGRSGSLPNCDDSCFLLSQGERTRTFGKTSDLAWRNLRGRIGSEGTSLRGGYGSVRSSPQSRMNIRFLSQMLRVPNCPIVSRCNARFNLRLPESVLTVLGKVVQDGTFCDVLHDREHLIDRPLLGPKVKAPTVELAGLLIVQIGGV